MAAYTVDASVFLNTFNPYEEGYEVSHLLLTSLRRGSLPIIVPTLVLPEVAAAVSRGRQDAALAREFAATLARLPNLILIPLDRSLAEQAVEIAAEHRLRGSDAIYAAVALRFGSLLVSLDREQIQRVEGVVPTRAPAEALAEIQPEP
ncbi:MAG TPA: PIN domain-containing protein [Anaerolineales bacterium]|nr:PIN domain-containing protein [Anaerolineales bacterium]